MTSFIELRGSKKKLRLQLKSPLQPEDIHLLSVDVTNSQCDAEDFEVKGSMKFLHLCDPVARANNAEPLLAPTRIGIVIVLSPSSKPWVLTQVIVHSI